jgi:hypothetical protein
VILPEHFEFAGGNYNTHRALSMRIRNENINSNDFGASE